MAHIPVMILIFLLNAINYAEASPKIQAAALRQWYCHRLIPSFLTSAVTPCTYPCLFVSHYEHPHIVVHPEPDGTPCRIRSALGHPFKVGKCGGSVCHTTAQHATLKRKKRFICLYALVKLIKTKKKLRELKEAIKRLESEGSRISSGPVNTPGGQGSGRSGSNVGNSGDAFSANSLNGPSGSAGIGGLSSSSERNPVIGNSGVGERAGSGLDMNGNSAAIGEMRRLGLHHEDLRALAAAVLGNNDVASLTTPDTRRDNGGTYAAPGGRFPTIGSTLVANSRGRETAGSEIGGSIFSSGNFGSTVVNGRGGVNAGPERIPNSGSLAASGSIGVGNIGGASLGGSGFAGASSSSIRLAFPGGSSNENPTPGGTGSGNRGSLVSASSASILNEAPAGASTALRSAALGSLTTIGTTSGGTSEAGSASSRGEFPSGVDFVDNNARETNFEMSSGHTLMNSNVGGTSIGSSGASSSVVPSVSTNNDAGLSNRPAILTRNSGTPLPAP